jgi:putative transcriptional regulator
MTIQHHPSTETLTAFANGGLDVARSIVISAHLESCAACRGHVRMLETVAGILLDDLEPTAMSDGALERTLALIEFDADIPPAAVVGDMDGMPEALRGAQLGPWRWIGPGTHYRSTNIVGPDGYRVFLLRAQAGSRLPHHTHTGVELTLTLKGAYEHVGGRFGVGDLEEADDDIEHQPVVAPGSECICLVAMNGNLQLLGVMGRLLQPFVRL